ncbi:MAG TPA: hypothetical protein VHP61_01310, partial [Acidobacteriota bacterium]|nr:hypothetical protein [Acidobacteriota bacterium]
GHYPSVIAVASGRPAPGGGVALWECTPPSVFTHVTAPAVVPGENTPPDPAFAVATGGSLVALIMEKLPLGPKDLPGQYVMRIRDILAASAQPALLGFKSFNLRAGYGWIDAQRAVTSSLAEYLKKRDAIDEDFRKRMERHIKTEKEQMEKNKESK